MTTQEIVNKIEDILVEFKVEHEKTTKVSASRARKLIGEVKKLSNDYRKASIEEGKK